MTITNGQIGGKSPKWSLDASGNPVGLVGPDGSTIFVPQILARSGVPIGIPSSGTVGVNGALSGLTAFDQIYSNGVWLYFPAGACYAGSVAAFYWVVMSSTTAGTIYNNTHTPGTNSSDIPASPTAIAAAGPGAYTGVTTEVTAAQWTIPGNTLGINGVHRTTAIFSANNNTNTKVYSSKLANSVLGLSNVVTTNRFVGVINSFRNRGRVNSQIVPPFSNDIGSGTSLANAAATASIDTSIDQNYSLTLQHNGAVTPALDWIMLETYFAEVIPS